MGITVKCHLSVRVFHRQQCCRTVHSAKVWWKFSHRSCVEYNCTSESLPLPRTDKLSLTALILSNNWPLSKQLQMSIWCPDFQHGVTNQLFTASILFWIPLFHTFIFIFPIFLQHYKSSCKIIPRRTLAAARSPWTAWSTFQNGFDHWLQAARGSRPSANQWSTRQRSSTVPS